MKHTFVYVWIFMGHQTEICSSQKTIEQYKLWRWFSHSLSFSEILFLGNICTEVNDKGCKENCSLTDWLDSSDIWANWGWCPYSALAYILRYESHPGLRNEVLFTLRFFCITKTCSKRSPEKRCHLNKSILFCPHSAKINENVPLTSLAQITDGGREREDTRWCNTSSSFWWIFLDTCREVW